MSVPTNTVEDRSRPSQSSDGDQDMQDDSVKLSDFIMVSSRDDVQRLAGKIAWNARREGNVPMLASGAASINTAVQAIAMARDYLGDDEEPRELLCQPAFRSDKHSKSLAFYLTTSRFRKTDLDTSSASFTVSKASKHSVVAGAIAARAREGVGPIVTAIGEEAACNALMATCKARLYLEEDNLDVRFVAVVENVEKTGGDGITKMLQALKLRIYVEEV